MTAPKIEIALATVTTPSSPTTPSLPSTPPSSAPPIVLDVRSLLAWTNTRIHALKQWLHHRHDDAAFWAERGVLAGECQRERETLRQVANLLHVERATRRGRLHGFASLAEQAAWLARMERVVCARAASYLHVARESTLIALREGRVTREPEREPGLRGAQAGEVQS